MLSDDHAKTLHAVLVTRALMFAYAPIMIANAPYESTMLLVQKIFYFHVPTWMAMFTAVFVCGICSAIYLFQGNPAADRSPWPRPRLR